MAAPTLAVAAVLASPVPAAHACLTTLPADLTLQQAFADGAARSAKVLVTVRGGATVRKLRVSMYTYAGDSLGAGEVRRAVRGSTVVTMRLRYGLQAGRYTLYATGEPNADRSCGPKHTQSSIEVKTCAERLPVVFPRRPGGPAAGYAGTLKVALRTRGGLLRNLSLTLSDFAGAVYAQARVDVLYGELDVVFNLARELTPGGYSVYVTGVVPGEPKTCDVPSATGILYFG